MAKIIFHNGHQRPWFTVLIGDQWHWSGMGIFGN